MLFLTLPLHHTCVDNCFYIILIDYFAIMPKIFDPILEGAVLALHDLKWSSRMIVRHFKVKKVPISQTAVINIINNRGKIRESRQLGEQYKFQRTRPVRTKKLVKLVATESERENPPTQAKMASKFGCALSTISNIIHKDLGKQTRRKSKTHGLTEDQENRRARAAKILLKNEITDERLEYLVTIDEAWLAVQDCNRKSDICYVDKGESVPDNWTQPRAESFGPKVMAVGILTGRGTVPLFFVPPKAKINSQYYIDFVLRPLVENYLPKLYGRELDKIWIHHDKATSHTSAQTAQYMRDVTEATGIRFIKTEEIPVKSPDASPLDFFGFGYLKGKLKRRRVKTVAGLKRAAKEEWQRISRETVIKTYKSWQKRLKLVVSNHGRPIEGFKSLHNKYSD